MAAASSSADASANCSRIATITTGSQAVDARAAVVLRSSRTPANRESSAPARSSASSMARGSARPVRTSPVAAFVRNANLVEELTGPHAERPSQLLDNRDGGVPAPPLDIADICAVDPGTVGIILLAPALRLAKPTNIFAKAGADIHARTKSAMSPIDLQTISDIALDCCDTRSLHDVTDRRHGGRDER